MDTTETTHISLCTGYGGIDLGLRRCIPGLRTVAYSEIETAACELLLARMEGGSLDPAPIWTDLKSFPWSAFSDRVDILSGGYPCQPFSAAGKRLGADDPRHLWPHIATGIQLLKPRLCFFENVEGHITLGLRDVLHNLGELGYRATWGIFSASEVGAPHQRRRVFIMAYRIGEGLERYAWDGAGVHRQGWVASEQDRSACQSGVCAWPSRPGEPQHAWEPPRVVGGLEDSASKRSWSESGDAFHEGGQPGSPGKTSLPQNTNWENGAAITDNQPTSGDDRAAKEWEPPRVVGNAESGTRFGRASGDKTHFAQSNEGVGDTSLLYGSGQARGQRQTQVGRAGTARHNWQTQSAMGRDINGLANGLDYGELCVSCDNRTDELRMLGNGVVPATAERAFRVLISELTHNTTKP